MSKFSLVKTTEVRLGGESEQWGLALGGRDFVEMTTDELDQLRRTIEEALGMLNDKNKSEG